MHIRTDRPLLLFVGSRAAGRETHLTRFVKRRPDLYDHARVDACDGLVPAYTMDEVFTYFAEDAVYHIVLTNEIVAIRADGRSPVIGITPEGYDRYASRVRAGNKLHRSIPCVAILLQTPSADRPDERRLSRAEIPPSCRERLIVIPVLLQGSVDDDQAIDLALASVL